MVFSLFNEIHKPNRICLVCILSELCIFNLLFYQVKGIPPNHTPQPNTPLPESNGIDLNQDPVH